MTWQIPPPAHSTKVITAFRLIKHKQKSFEYNQMFKCVKGEQRFVAYR